MTQPTLKDKITETAAATAEKAKEGLSAAASYGRDAGQALKETVTEAATAKVEGARETLVETGERLAQSLQDNADDLDGMPRRLVSGVASGLSQATGSLRSNSLSDIAGQVRRQAQAHPGTFIVAAAVAGFALARFLTAVPPDDSASNGNARRARDRA